MSLRFAVVHEAPADFSTATELADREIVDAIGWLDDESIVHQRTWVQHSPTGEPLLWKKIGSLAAEAHITASGHFNGEPGEPDAAAARRAIRYLRYTYPDLNGIVLVRDQDDQPERRRGLEQAREVDDRRVPLVIGFAIVERESWVIAGFDPLDQGETDCHDAERQHLGFDPRTQSEDLTACKDDTAKRSPKRVLAVLCGKQFEREQRCWRETPLRTLRERGANNGLAAFLEEVREKLAPLIGHVDQE